MGPRRDLRHIRGEGRGCHGHEHVFAVARTLGMCVEGQNAWASDLVEGGIGIATALPCECGMASRRIDLLASLSKFTQK